jgi:radical SAM superfamily enzyme YgiQ (UPF0313 family)
MIMFVEPLGLECVAAVLEQEGHACQIVDFRLETMDRGMSKLRAFGPDVIGLQCGFTTERYRVAYFVQRIRGEFPDARIVIGGHDASRDPHWFMRNGVDVVAVGDGEEVIGGLIKAWEEDQNIRNVPGLVINTSEGPCRTGPARGRQSLNSLPLPARHLIQAYTNEYYINFRRPLALVETARGCPFQCNFCSVWKFHEHTYREKSPERVVDELIRIKAPNVFFTDDIFWLNAQRGRELAKAIKGAGIRKYFNIQTRTDIICRLPELIDLWKECGALAIFLGLEKVNDEGLKSINKNNRAANNNRAIQIVQEKGVGYTPSFIVDPGWERKDFDNLKRWIDYTGAYNSAFAILTPLPGTDLWENLKGDVTSEDWELYDLAHTVLPTRLPLKEFYHEYASLWRHVIDVRYEIHGKLRTHLEILEALVTRKVTVKAMRRGMRMAKILSKPEIFLQGHMTSVAKTTKAAQFLSPGGNPVSNKAEVI